MYSTPKQIALIEKLAARRGKSVIALCEEFGLGLNTARDLTGHDASQLIDWLLGKPISTKTERSSDAYKTAAAKAEADRAEFEKKYGR